jgi:hypothetical protein
MITNASPAVMPARKPRHAVRTPTPPQHVPVRTAVFCSVMTGPRAGVAPTARSEPSRANSAGRRATRNGWTAHAARNGGTS